MESAFVGEIRAFAFGYNPMAWLPCVGQQLYVQQYAALYSIIGTKFGGDGQTTFNLPNLQGYIIPCAGQLPGGENYAWTSKGGEATVALDMTEIPAHTHTVNGASTTTTPGTRLQTVPDNTSFISNIIAKVNATSPTGIVGRGYGPAPTTAAQQAPLNFNTIGPACGNATGGMDAHNNMMPYLVMNYCICINGLYPVKD